MAKGNRTSGKFKQDIVISQFSKDIRQMEKRTWLNATEQAIEKGKEKLKYQQSLSTPAPRISTYNPNNPLNGFKYKSKEEQQRITKMLKEQEKQRKLEENQAKNC
jgi:hypothetical protein